MTEPQHKIPYDKLKQLDKYAKSLGITIFELTYGFDYEGEIVEHKIIPFNISPNFKKQYPDVVKGFVQCL